MTTEEHNKLTLFNWLQIMNKNHEKIFFALAKDQNANLCIYTTMNNPDEIRNAIVHLLTLLNNSKEIITL